jgi:hypothetical protein
VRYALGAPLHPLVVTNIYNDPVYMLYSSLNSLFRVCNMYGDSIDLFRFNSYSIFQRHIKIILHC